MNPIVNWLSTSPEIFISVIGWFATYLFIIRAQDKQHKNEINHEVYKDLVKELDKYASQLSNFSSKVQAYKFTKSFKHLGTEKQAFKSWLEETINLGLNLKFYLFLRKWESYEIFVQNMSDTMLILKKENDKVTENFQNIFLLNDSEKAWETNPEKFESILDELYELSANVSCYIMDFKKILQNNFYKHYGIKSVKNRITEDKKYLVLTDKGLK